MKMKKFIVLMSFLAIVAMPVANAQDDKKEAQKANEPLDFYEQQASSGKQQSVHRDTLLHANTDTLMKHIRILSSSEYEGRVAGSQAYLDAAQYCAEVLSAYGVKPYGEEWNQYFPVEYNEIENCNFNTYVNDNDTRTRYVLGRDYVCGSMTGRGYVEAPVVFCGYGIDIATVGKQPCLTMVVVLHNLVGGVLVGDYLRSLTTIDAATYLVAHGISDVFAALLSSFVGKVVQSILLIEGAVQQTLMAHVDIAACTVKVAPVASRHQQLV